MTGQQGDVNLFQTDDGGNITVVNGVVEMNGGLGTAAYLSLFGGNEDDDGRADNPDTWWGNLDEVDPARRYRSETQHVLEALVASSGNLRVVEGAASRDLAWLVTSGAASEVIVDASIPWVNALRLKIDIFAQGEAVSFVFVENWKASI